MKKKRTEIVSTILVLIVLGAIYGGVIYLIFFQ